jgi:hypothetical protein
MADGGGSAIWPARLRWRLKGALLWPLFWLLTLVDAVLLELLPIAGADGPPVVGALLLALLFNIVAVAVFGRLGAWWLRRRRPDIPRVVADDRAGSAMLCAVTIALVVGGILHGPARDAAQHAQEAQREVVRAYVVAHAPAYRPYLAQMDTQQHAEDFFRTCVPGDPPLCLLVDTSHDPPLVRVDQDRTPNRHL